MQLRSRQLADRIYALGEREQMHHFDYLRELDEATAHMHDAARKLEKLLERWEPQGLAH